MDFIIYSEDKENSLHIRQSARDDHLAWLKAPSDINLLAAGPWLDDKGIMPVSYTHLTLPTIYSV